MSDVRSSDAIGIAFIILTATAYASMDITAKLAYEAGITVSTLLTTRFLGGGIVLLGLALLIRARPRRPARRMLIVLVIGGFAYALESFLLNSAINTMAVGPVILIFYTYPIIVAVAALAIGRERMNRYKLWALILSICGVAALLAFPTSGMNPRGVILAVGAAAAFATYALLAERLMTGVHAMLFSGVVMIGAGIPVCAGGLVSGGLQPPTSDMPWGYALAHIGLISVAITSLTAAISRLGATRAAIGNTFEPALTVMFASIILGEALGPLQVVGATALLAALVILPRARSTASALPIAE
jgi:drug/metabolite transporter (DMT)-like permease